MNGIIILYIAFCLVLINIVLLLTMTIKIQRDASALFETQDKYNELFEEHICKIYEIINYNNLIRPKKEEKKDDNKDTTIVQK